MGLSVDTYAVHSSCIEKYTNWSPSYTPPLILSGITGTRNIDILRNCKTCSQAMGLSAGIYSVDADGILHIACSDHSEHHHVIYVADGSCGRDGCLLHHTDSCC